MEDIENNKELKAFFQPTPKLQIIERGVHTEEQLRDLRISRLCTLLDIFNRILDKEDAEMREDILKNLNKNYKKMEKKNVSENG